mmetsp:Transcript_16091/g.34963  ORF Transcript_16091/g.34963 Transcript_16091/m.34963 type:complete len:200 (+) Transcript_16091:819-1418(+)
MPSSNTALNCPGVTISPSFAVTSSCRPSRCSRVNLYPHSASVSEISFSTNRSLPLRLNVACSFCCKMRMTSPGSMSGASSASPWKVIFCPWLMPFSTCTSRIFFSWITLLPLHCPHLSFSEIIWPEPLHSGHTDCICWTMPGPIWRMVTFIPEPWQPAHRPVLPDLEPTPLHLEQMTFLESESFLVAPLYMSSRVTLRG